MAVKIGSATLSTAYRGNVPLSKIYRGSLLIWSAAPAPTILGYVVDGINYNINKTAPSNSYVVDGINYSLK